ncbi:hypothetical protein SETIT_3G318900v2 [Setaria italica]|uniref:Uncharacterized protein n=1 Tax=Setaria italica TaxID=4555 RepID=A0A368QKZ2_SETIT|nr:hypothetical protein SETIT_3G318900v2 [Setaria italica]
MSFAASYRPRRGAALISATARGPYTKPASPAPTPPPHASQTFAVPLAPSRPRPRHPHVHRRGESWAYPTVRGRKENPTARAGRAAAAWPSSPATASDSPTTPATPGSRRDEVVSVVVDSLSRDEAAEGARRLGVVDRVARLRRPRHRLPLRRRCLAVYALPRFSPPPTSVPAGPPHPAPRAVAAALPAPVPLPRKILRPPGKPQAPSRPPPPTDAPPSHSPPIPRRPIRWSDGQGCGAAPPGAPQPHAFSDRALPPRAPPPRRSCGPMPGTVLSWGSFGNDL